MPIVTPNPREVAMDEVWTVEMVAERYEELWAEHMPLTHASFVKNGRVAP